MVCFKSKYQILGAHSFGKFHGSVAYFKYAWTRAQTNLLNNQLFKHYAKKPQYFGNCKPQGMVRYGDAWGKPADIVWIVRDNKLSKGGGPF